MKPRWLGVIVVLGIAFGIVGYRAGRSTEKAKRIAVAAPAGTSNRPAAVVLVADLDEAEDPCICGQIIRSVRATASKGIPTKEIDPAKSPEIASSYKARVAPAVVFLDGNGKELRRFEGESDETLSALRSALEQIPSRSP